MSKAKIYDPDFGERLQWILREKFNGNNSEFARTVGIAITSLNRWLIGEADPSRTNLIKTAKAAGVSLEWLATGKGEQIPNKSENVLREAQNSYNTSPKLQTGESEMIVNKAKLQEAIETLEEVLEITNKAMKPEGKAQMIWAFYELLTQENSEKEKMIKLLKLVA